MNAVERWLPLANYAGYEISDQGRVRRGERIRKLTPDENGYLRVSFWVDGRAKKVAVHLLVAETFLGPRPAGMVTRHLSGDKTDCRLSKLSYGTPEENEADKDTHGTKVNGTKHHSHKLTEAAVIAMRQRYATGGITLRELALEFSINHASARKIVERISWKHVP